MFIAFIIVGAICLLYGTVVLSAASGTPFFAVWYALGAVFLVSAWALHAGVWEALPVFAKRGLQALAGVFIALLVVTQACALSCFSTHCDEELDYLIVLGAQVRPTGPSTVLKYRLDAALEYLEAHPDTKCIVSGGQGANEIAPEGDIMRDYLVEQGVDPARILCESASLNTVQNIENSMELIDPAKDHVGIVTNNFHLFRGMAIARKKGIEHVYGIAADSLPGFLPNNMLRESFSIAKDFLQGNI